MSETKSVHNFSSCLFKIHIKFILISGPGSSKFFTQNCGSHMESDMCVVCGKKLVTTALYDGVFSVSFGTCYTPMLDFNYV
jgi:hypothetical protein